MKHVPDFNLVLLASIPGYPDRSEVEVSRVVWPSLRDDVLKCSESLTIALDSDLQGASSTVAFPEPTLQPVIPSRNDVAPLSFPESYGGSNEFGAKNPVIYLFPPSRLPEVTVQLMLTPPWRFSLVYPSPQSTTGPSEDSTDVRSLTWAVQAEPDGSLKEKNTGTDVAYLFWEADVKPGLSLPSQDLSCSAGPVVDTGIEDMPETFDPSRPSLSPDNSVVLPIDEVLCYLDLALQALTLDTEARTSFITYWLPNLRKHEFVALRFISQKSYEKAAQMSISPTPDIVTRVFMLFCGVRSDDMVRWAPAITRAKDDATCWTKVVGVDAERASDVTLFRVLEWGGMEVKS